MKILKALLIVLIFLIGIPSSAQSNDDKKMIKFNQIDMDSNEVITIREMVAYYKGMTDENGVPFDAKKMFYGLDANKNSIITQNEYEKKAEPVTVDSPSEAYVKKRIVMFSEVDIDANYKITLKELQDYYKDKTNKSGNPINAELRFIGLDLNDDESIELAEFATKINWKMANQKYKAKKQ